MGDNRGITSLFGHFDGCYGFAKCAYLIDFDKDGVGNTLFYPTLQALGIGHEEIVADQLYFVGQLRG